jgi:hypothetical protein
MESFAKRMAAAILCIPIALLAIWLDAPWWAFPLAIGFAIFACYSAWETDAIPLIGVAIAFGISIILALVSYIGATHMGVSIADLTQDQTLPSMCGAFRSMRCQACHSRHQLALPQFYAGSPFHHLRSMMLVPNQLLKADRLRVGTV